MITISPVLPIFISHAHEDSAYCRALVEGLEQYGARVWFDATSLRYGRLASQIDRELTARPVFIGVLSPAAVDSPWVREEVEAAFTLQREEPERIPLFVVAKACTLPPRWAGWVRESGPGDSALAPDVAADTIARRLAGWFSPADVEPVRAAWAHAEALRARGCRHEALAAYGDALSRAYLSARSAGTYYDGLRDRLRYTDPAIWESPNTSITMNATAPAAWNREGDRLRHRGDLEEALGCYQQALSRDLYSVRAWIGAAIALEGLGQDVDALSALEYGLSLDARSCRGWEAKGRVLQRRGQLDQAMDAYDQALQILVRPGDYEPTTGMAHGWTGTAAKYKRAMLALLTRWQQRWVRQGRTLQTIASPGAPGIPSVNSTDASSWITYGKMLQEVGHADGAVRAFARALLLDQGSAIAWYLKGVALRALKYYEEADVAFKQVLVLDEHFADAWVGRGDVLYQQGYYTAAVEAFRQAQRLRPQDAVIWRSLGSALREAGALNEALAAYHRALEFDPDAAVIWCSLAKALERLRRFDEAIGAYNRALALDPVLEDAHWHREVLLQTMALLTLA